MWLSPRELIHNSNSIETFCSWWSNDFVCQVCGSVAQTAYLKALTVLFPAVRLLAVAAT
jgi:hypothetical protein